MANPAGVSIQFPHSSPLVTATSLAPSPPVTVSSMPAAGTARAGDGRKTDVTIQRAASRIMVTVSLLVCGLRSWAGPAAAKVKGSGQAGSNPRAMQRRELTVQLGIKG